MESNGEADSDICSSEDLSRLFPITYTSVTSATVAKKDTYCLHLASDTTWNNVAVAMSDKSVAVLKGDTLQKMHRFQPHEKTITGLRFSSENSNLVWTSSTDGFVKLWDARSNRMEKEFSGETEGSVVRKPLNAFDVSINERILGAGTELVERGSYLLFWDIRGKKCLGAYWDSHVDDITQVKFHPLQPDTVGTSSTDGLINIFDISQNTEDDALTYCLNANVTVDKLSWFKQSNQWERLAGITDIHSLQYWNVQEASPLYEFSREKITAAMRRKNEEECYLISVNMFNSSEEPIVLAGSGLEDSTCMRLLKLDLEVGQLLPHGMLVCKQKQMMTRAALYQAAADLYITAGECGIVRVWKKDEKENIGKDPVTKQLKKKRAKPY